MSSVPRHVHRLSEIYWEMVDELVDSGFPLENAKLIVNMFFKDFNPLPRKSVKPS